MHSTQLLLAGGSCVGGDKNKFRTFISRRLSSVLDGEGSRVSVKRQVSSTRKLQVQIPLIGSSHSQTSSSSSSPIQVHSVGSSNIRAARVGSCGSQTTSTEHSHVQEPSMTNSQTRAPSVNISHIQIPTLIGSHTKVPSIASSYTYVSSVNNSHTRTPTLRSSHTQVPSIDSLHSQASSNSSSYTRIPSLIISHTDVPSICSTHFHAPPKEQTYSMCTTEIQTCPKFNPQERSPSLDVLHDSAFDKADVKNPSSEKREDHSTSPGNSQDNPSSVSELLDHSLVRDSQNTDPHVFDADVPIYKSGILQLRALRLCLLKDSPCRRQNNSLYCRRHTCSTSSEGLKTLLAKSDFRGNTLEEIPHFVNNQHENRFLADGLRHPTFVNNKSSTNQDIKYPFLSCYLQKPISKRLHKEDSRKPMQTFFPKELRVNKSLTCPHAARECNRIACSDACLAVRKDRKRILDKNCYYEAFLDSSLGICAGQDSNQVKLQPRLRLSGLPHLAGDRKSVVLNEINQPLQSDGNKPETRFGNFSSKGTDWKRWIGNALAVRQTRERNPGDNFLIKRDYRRLSGYFTPGDPYFHPGHDTLSSSGTGSEHSTDDASRWYRPRRDPPASPADLDDFLSPVTRVIITTAEQHL